MPAASETPSIVHNNVIFEAAILENGSTVDISVEDFCPHSDGVNEIHIPWSESNLNKNTLAKITFEEKILKLGIEEVHIWACHRNSLQFKAYDTSGTLVATQTHPGPKREKKLLILKGTNIARVEIIGSEISINELCYVWN
jgi:hypothetical protein